MTAIVFWNITSILQPSPSRVQVQMWGLERGRQASGARRPRLLPQPRLRPPFRQLPAHRHCTSHQDRPHPRRVQGKATYILEKFEHTCYIQKDDEGCISFSTLSHQIWTQNITLVCVVTRTKMHFTVCSLKQGVVLWYHSTAHRNFKYKKVNWGKFVYTHCVKARSEKFCFGVCLTKLHDPNCF